MRTKHSLLLLPLFIANLSLAQIDFEEFEEKMEMNTETKDYSWAHKNLFLDYKLSGPSEFSLRNGHTTEYIIDDIIDDDTITIQHNYWGIGLFGITLEPRVNLISGHNFAVHLRAPIALNFSVSRLRPVFTYSWNEYSSPWKSVGMFSVNAPILIGWSKGLNATYNATNNNGFSIAAGYQMILAPILGGDKYIKQNRTVYYKNDVGQPSEIPSSEFYEIKKLHMMPVVQIDYYKLSRKNPNAIRGFSLAFCPYNEVYVKLALNFSLASK